MEMRKHMKISAGILAGGKSSRMGKNKALLTINQRRFIDKIADELGSFSEVLISAADKGDYEDMGLEVVYDGHRDIGPIEGIYRILSAAKEEYVFICAADMPFITKELVQYMTEFVCSDYDCYVMEDDEHIHPLCGIYSKRMLDKVCACIESGDYRLMRLLDSVRTKYIKLEDTSFDKRVVKNINTRAQYRELVVLPAVFCVSGVKDSGKTGLIIKLINEFIREGYVVNVIKHDGHDYVMDYEGTDTFRFRGAGGGGRRGFYQKKLDEKGPKKGAV
ncbi:MAG: molybdopterin-guanine dinucleotide biosynthesis protein MobB [Lachnospiraceae bacterium]|nr:molybdopterin-guanine dinucleotide biosynthesis protein MobB [Lachnospiraceae bacterium]